MNIIIMYAANLNFERKNVPGTTFPEDAFFLF